MGKCFLTDNSPTVDRILMIFSTDPHEISILMKWQKVSPLARLQAHARKLCILSIADLGQFWPIFAKMLFGFSERTFFPLSASK